MPMIELNKGRYALVTETAISLFAEVAQLLFVKRVANKRQHDADGRLDIAKACQRSDVLPRNGGPALWQVQSAVRRQPRQRCALKIQRRRAAPGADVMHDALRSRDRQSGWSGQRVSVRVVLGGPRIIK